MEADDKNKVYSTNAYQLQIVVTGVIWNMTIINTATPRPQQGECQLLHKNHHRESAGSVDGASGAGWGPEEGLLAWGRREGEEDLKRTRQEVEGVSL